MLFSKQTPAAGGTAFAQFDAAWCYNGNGYIFNDTGTSLDVRIGDSGSVQTIAASALLPIKLVNSMAELYVRRTDQSTTQVTVEAQVGTGSAGGGTSAEVGVIAATTAAAATAAHNLAPGAHRRDAGLPATAFGTLANCLLWQHFDPSVGSTHVCVPHGRENLHTEFVFRADATGLRGLATISVVRPFVFTPYNGTGVSVVGTWTETAADAKYRAGKAYYATANSASISFAFEGTACGVWFHTTTNAGWVLVAIDGDFTAATTLPKVTADMCSATPDATHPFALGDVGKRYIKQLYASPCDRWELIADGLAAGSHTVTLAAAAVTSFSYRPYISGFGACSSTTGFTATGTVPAAVAKVCAGVGIGASQYAISEICPVMLSSVKGDFVGGAHGSEVQTSYLVFTGVGTVYHDASGTLPTANSKTAVANVEIRRTSTITHGGVDLATRTLVLDFSGSIKGSALLRDKWEWLVGANASFISRSYPLMLPAGHSDAGLVRTCDFDSAAYGAQTEQGFLSDDVIHYSGGSEGRLYRRGGFALFGKMIPDIACQSFLHDRPMTQGPKLYFCRRGLDQPDYVATGRVDSSESIIGVLSEP